MTNIEKIERKFIDYCETEYRRTVLALSKPHCNTKEVADNSIQRMLGAGEFIQTLGVSYEFTERYFNDFKERINLITMM